MYLFGINVTYLGSCIALLGDDDQTSLASTRNGIWSGHARSPIVPATIHLVPLHEPNHSPMGLHRLQLVPHELVMWGNEHTMRNKHKKINCWGQKIVLCSCMITADWSEGTNCPSQSPFSPPGFSWHPEIKDSYENHWKLSSWKLVHKIHWFHYVSEPSKIVVFSEYIQWNIV